VSIEIVTDANDFSLCEFNNAVFVTKLDHESEDEAAFVRLRKKQPKDAGHLQIRRDAPSETPVSDLDYSCWLLRKHLAIC